MASSPKKKKTPRKVVHKPRVKRPAAEEVLPETGLTTPLPSANGKKILITDDDPALSHVLQLKFQNAGFNVTVCHDGQQAIDAMHREKFDGMILDLIMPLKTGFDVLTEKPKTKNKTTPVFVMSDMRTPETTDQVMSLGATNFFIKMQMPLKEVIDIMLQSA